MTIANEDVIELCVDDIAQLFHTLDPFPFRERDLGREAEEYLVGWARELAADQPITLVIYFLDIEAQTNTARDSAKHSVDISPTGLVSFSAISMSFFGSAGPVLTRYGDHSPKDANAVRPEYVEYLRPEDEMTPAEADLEGRRDEAAGAAPGA